MTDEQIKEKFKDLVDEIECAASKFSYDKSICDFEMTVRITCENGWCGADLISVH